MRDCGLSSVPVSRIPRIAVVEPDPPSFAGFASGAFDVLTRLRGAPNIDTYRQEKVRLQRTIQEPFRRYRDDLVVGSVLPNRIEVETERNVFSRILKNDFGRGGAHHHYWMSFYRPGNSRLRDLQFIHSLHPQAFYIGLSASTVGRSMLRHVKRRMTDEPEVFAAAASSAMASTGAELHIRIGDDVLTVDDPLDLSAWLPHLQRAETVRLLRAIPKEDVIRLQERLVTVALDHVRHLWPVYHFLISEGEVVRRH